MSEGKEPFKEKEQSNKKEEPKRSPNDICNGCLKWAQFGESCRVYWEGKRFCTVRVATVEEWDSEQHLLKR